MSNRLLQQVYLEQQRENIEYMTAIVRSSISRLTEYRSALITAAVTGQIEGLR